MQAVFAIFQLGLSIHCHIVNLAHSVFLPVRLISVDNLVAKKFNLLSFLLQLLLQGQQRVRTRGTRSSTWGRCTGNLLGRFFLCLGCLWGFRISHWLVSGGRWWRSLGLSLLAFGESRGQRLLRSVITLEERNLVGQERKQVNCWTSFDQEKNYD